MSVVLQLTEGPATLAKNQSPTADSCGGRDEELEKLDHFMKASETGA